MIGDILVLSACQASERARGGGRWGASRKIELYESILLHAKLSFTKALRKQFEVLEQREKSKRKREDLDALERIQQAIAQKKHRLSQSNEGSKARITAEIVLLEIEEKKIKALLDDGRQITGC
jgi:hypothetical protein